MRLRIDNVVFNYGSTEILKEVCLDAYPGEILGILGPNGSGKTTLLRCINGILTPKQGSIALDGADIEKMSRIELSKRVGYVPQHATHEACTPTVYEVVLMGRRPHVSWEFGAKDRDMAWQAMEEMDVKHLSSQRFDRLSSGQAQRVLMARAIAQEVRMLLLDEPTSNLDVRYQIDVMRTIHDQVRTKNMGACAVVHDLDLAMRFCAKVVMLHDGKVLAAGNRENVLNPENIRTAYGVDSVIDNIHGRERVLIL
ncbi:MAG: ABC transporter ATP-binding protein [Methanomassiliicoccus sp.]|nr:ABC transporter ATP-binding protein [Methanomassiliicoccus sp.]